jgi:hypothetical protein
MNLFGVSGSGPFDAARQLRTVDAATYCWVDGGTLTKIAASALTATGPTVPGTACATEILDALSE